MADLRVNDIDADLLYDLKVIALDRQITLRQIVIDILEQYRNRQAKLQTRYRKTEA